MVKKFNLFNICILIISSLISRNLKEKIISTFFNKKEYSINSTFASIIKIQENCESINDFVQ